VTVTFASKALKKFLTPIASQAFCTKLGLRDQGVLGGSHMFFYHKQLKFNLNKD